MPSRTAGGTPVYERPSLGTKNAETALRSWDGEKMKVVELLNKLQGLLRASPEIAQWECVAPEWEDDDGNLQGGGTLDTIIPLQDSQQVQIG